MIEFFPEATMKECSVKIAILKIFGKFAENNRVGLFL